MYLWMYQLAVMTFVLKAKFHAKHWLNITLTTFWSNPHQRDYTQEICQESCTNKEWVQVDIYCISCNI